MWILSNLNRLIKLKEQVIPRKEIFKSKNQLVNKILKYVDKIDGEGIIDAKNKTISAKFDATMTGDYMPNDGFTQKQLEQLGLLIKPINERLTSIENRLENVENRLDAVEKDIKSIKNCPTIQKEIKED